MCALIATAVLTYGSTRAGEQAAATAAVNKPNIVIIVADDLGWADVGYHGSPIQTPNIDRLVRQGVELDRFYVYPVCSPTRAGLMTGRNPIRPGVGREKVMLPRVLAQAGYQHRAIFGKWHNGPPVNQVHPLDAGFTHFYGHRNGYIDYFTHEWRGPYRPDRKDRPAPQLDWYLNQVLSHDKGYSTNLIADAAVKFIEQHGDDGPFFCYVPFNAPHHPLQAPQEYLDRYEHLKTRQTYAAMVTCLDDGIGRILAAVDRAGIADDTLVWFFSDNGGTDGYGGSNKPLRGKKTLVFEGGVRVPAAVRWPNVLPAGSKVSAPVAHIDVMPTLMRVLGIKDHAGKPLDGVDVLDVLTGKTTKLDRDLFVYMHGSDERPEQVAVITPQWKLVVNGPNIADDTLNGVQRQRLLFRIDSDPLEQHDVSAEHPDMTDKLYEKLKSFRALRLTDK